MHTEAKPRVCIVIISYNSAATLPRCLEALKAQTYGDFRLVLIDNASERRPGALMVDLPFPAAYLEMTENLGFAPAMNIGLDAADGDFLVALNPDAFPEPTWLAELVAAADGAPPVAAFGSLQLSAGHQGRIDGFGDHYMVWGQAWRGHTLPPTQHPLEYCFGVCAAAALYRTAPLRLIGGFDGRFFCFYEDVDVSFRLRLAGYHCAVVPAAVVQHVGGASFEGKSAFAQFLTARNQWWMLIKNMPLLFLIVAVPGFLAIHGLSALKTSRPATLKGLWAGVRQTGTFLKARRDVQTQRKISYGELARWLTWWPAAFLKKTSVVRQVTPADR